MAVEVSDFQREVIARSREIPVVVDFWAPWCGPCRVLGPVLEKLAAENGAAWTLAKVNTDLHPEVSMRYGIRGIPAVKLFIDGTVVDEFVGALPEYEVRRWLDQALPSENRQRVEQAEAALHAGRAEQAEALLRQALAEEPDYPQAQILLAHLLAFHAPDEALDLARRAADAEPAYLPLQQAVETLARLLRLEDHDLPDEDGKAAYADALAALARRDFDAVVSKLIEVLQQNRYYDDDGARKAGIALFTLLGPDHPTTHKHRRTFDMWLY